MKAPFVTIKDALLIPYLLGLYMVVLFTPRQHWELVSRAVSRCVITIVQLLNKKPYLPSVSSELHLVSDVEPVENHLAGRVLNQMFFLCHYVPWRSPPVFRLVGRELIDKALEEARGGVLWMQPTVFGALGTKAALYCAGYELFHLSHVTHGLSDSVLGSRMLNPIWTSVEKAYLAERLVMSPDHPRTALRALAEKLKHNQLIGILAGQRSQKVYTLPGQSECMSLSASPANLAWKHRAMLLYVFTIREADGTIVAHVHPSCDPSDYQEREQFVHEALTRYASYLEKYVTSSPDQVELIGVRHRAGVTKNEGEGGIS